MTGSRVEPGIRFTAEHVVGWIPGSRFTRPGMTTSVRSRNATVRNDGARYSAAAMRGRPTKPEASPKRSTITAGRSLALLVTQAPERTV